MLIPEFQRLQDLLASFLGQPKNPVSDGCLQLQFPCPKCVEEKGKGEVAKYNLEVTLSKSLYSRGGLFKCWSCCSVDDEMQGSVYKLIRKYGTTDILKEYQQTVNEIRNSGLYKLPEYQSILGENENDFCLVLPSSFTPIKNVDRIKKQAKEYLEKRHIDQGIVDKFGIGYTQWEEIKPSYRNRIVVPSYDAGGNLNFWVGRDYTENPKRTKYRNCDGVKKSDIVYLESKIEWDADVYIAEGALDAVFCPNCTAFLGKTLSKDDALYRTIYDKANAKVVIVLDADTDIKETKRIYRLLDRGRLRGRIRYVRMEAYKDFGQAYEEGGKDAVISIIQNQQTFSEIELLI